MRRIAGLIAACGVLAGAVVPVRAQETEVLRLAPFSAWVLDYADDSCALRRAFGEEGMSVVLEMRQFAPNEDLQFSIYSDQLGTSARDIAYRVDPDESATVVESGYFVNFGETGEGVTFGGDLRRQALRPDPDETVPSIWSEPERNARESEITSITIPSGFERPLVLATGALVNPMQAMRGCLDELLTHWGIDAEAHHQLTRLAEPVDMQSLARYISERYPSQMIQNGQSATLRIRLMVGQDGRPTGCFSQFAVGEEAFEEAACRQMMRRARFVPALDVAGNPIASYWTTSILYQLSG